MEEKEKIIEIEIERLRDFKEHPFQVKDDEEMRQLKDSISEYGVLNPLIVRPRPEGVYEIISGHRLKGKKTVELISEASGDSPKQVQRYIKITELIPELMQQLDDGNIGFNPAVEIAFLKKEEQKQLLEAMEYAQSSLSLSQAQRIKKLSKEGNLSLEKMEDIMSEIKKGEMASCIMKRILICFLEI